MIEVQHPGILTPLSLLKFLSSMLMLGASFYTQFIDMLRIVKSGVVSNGGLSVSYLCIKEALYIRMENKNFNRDKGIELSGCWTSRTCLCASHYFVSF